MSSTEWDRSLVLDAVCATEAAAVAAWSLTGRGDEKAARATEVKAKVIDGDGGKKQGKKALLARIQQLEQRLSGGNQ